MSKRIPFNVKFRLQIESGEYKVILDCGIEAEILAWDSPGEYPIICIAKKEDAIPFRTDNAGHAYHYPLKANYSDLLLEPKMSEFEKALSKCLCDAVVRPEEDYDKWAKEYAPKLLELAREELLSEKMLIEQTYNPDINNARELDRKEGIMLGKAETLKDLPRWKMADRDWDAGTIDFAVFHRNDGGDHEDWFSVEVTNRLYKGEYYIELSDLEKLPKEEQKW